MFVPQKKALSFEEHNKQFVKNCKCQLVSTASFLTCIQSLSEVFTSLVDDKLSQITCNACLSLATDFGFDEKL